MVNMMDSKSGIFFSLDAVLALTAAFVIIGSLGVYYTVAPEMDYRDKHADSEDIMAFLLNTHPDDVEGIEVYANQTDDGSILELIGSFWASGNISAAEDITKTVLDGRTDRCWEMDFSGDSIGGGCEEGDTVSVSSRVVSGYEAEKEPEGYIVRGRLTETDSVFDSSYTFFSGYVGDGNITKTISLDNIESIENTTMEVDAGGNFTLYINDQFSGYYSTQSGSQRADRWKIDEDHWDNFVEGENKLQFNFTEEGASFSGGFFNVVYMTDDFQFKHPDTIQKKNLPGIDGVINLYSSFYVPGEIQNISAYLDYKSEYNISLVLGNVTVYENSSHKRKQVELFDHEVRTCFDESDVGYSDISDTTVPLRLSMSNVTDLLGREADVFSVVDVSGSMGACDVPAEPEDDYECENNCQNPGFFCCWFNNCNTESGCEACDGTWVDFGKERITVAKQATRDFVDNILNTTGNRVGLNAYESVVEEQHAHDLSKDNESLYDKVEDWEAGGGTCICCGVNDARQRLVDQSNESRYRSMVMMSDGIANVECSEQGTGDAAQDAIESACYAYEEYGIEVYTIGFGPKEQIDEETMQEMADCANGKYYYSDLGNLEDIYESATEDMLKASYEDQELNVREPFSENITLYPDSYIRFNYTETGDELQYGEIPLTFQSKRFEGDIESPKEGNFSVGDAARPLGARVTSYSSRFWTSLVDISNDDHTQNIYNLTNFGREYEKLGDPYTVNIPRGYISHGNNQIYLDTSRSPGNFTGGSPDSRVIYDVAVNGSVGYGDSFPEYEGGTVTVDLASGETYELIVGNNTDTCDFERDALCDMVLRLTEKLDVNNDGMVDVMISEENLEIGDTRIGGVPYLWGPGVFTMKIW